MYVYACLKMYELSCGEATLWAGGQGYLRLRECVICALTSLGLAHARTHQPTFAAVFFQACFCGGNEKTSCK